MSTYSDLVHWLESDPKSPETYNCLVEYATSLLLRTDPSMYYIPPLDPQDVAHYVAREVYLGIYNGDLKLNKWSIKKYLSKILKKQASDLYKSELLDHVSDKSMKPVLRSKINSRDLQYSDVKSKVEYLIRTYCRFSHNSEEYLRTKGQCTYLIKKYLDSGVEEDYKSTSEYSKFLANLVIIELEK